MFNSGDRTILHCTAKFFGFSKPQKNKTPPGKNSKTRKDSISSEYSENVQEHLGHVQKLKIVGYFFTEHTVGCRIELSDEQQKLYDQEEDFHSLKKRQFGNPNTTKTPTKKENNLENSALSTSSGITNVELKYENSNQRFYPIPGRGKRAHITLGTAKGARAVNTGIDLLDIVLAEKNANEATTNNNNKPFEMTLESCKAVVRHYKPNFWVVYPEEGILMDSMFTGHY